MEPFRRHEGRMAPLDRANVDTDQIIPKQFLKRIERSGFGPFLFYDWRRNEPDFVLNRPEYEGATVLVTGANFGCGSSREHAVWALQDYGFQAVIAPSFADIFLGNATGSGLVAARVSDESMGRLLNTLAARPDAEITVDVAGRTVSAGTGVTEPFQLADYARWRLLEGLDDIGLTLRHEAAIAAYEQRRPAWLPALGASG
jgi:3-isopropylmalate/(R)-2-methylmalate dehydratase small subunit